MRLLTKHTVTSFVITDGGVARNAGGGLVGLPVLGHDLKAGDTITIAGTVNYDGTEVVASVTANEVVITEAFTAETFGAGDTVIRQALDHVVRGVKPGGEGSNVRLALDVTSLVGTTQQLDITVEFTAGAQNFVYEAVLPVGYASAFAQATGATKETIVVPNCPYQFDIRVNFTNTITDADFTVHGERV